MPDFPPVWTDRATAAVLGGAIGDALGMPGQTLTRAEIARHYGQITGFLPPCVGHRVSHGLVAGQVTDDTEQTLLLAGLLIAGQGRVDPQDWARALLGWEADVAARGLSDLLGPSTRAALNALLAGESPDVTGRRGTTNGAAMRIAPVGIAVPPEPLGRLVDAVEATCRVTHNTGEAIAGAAAVAAVISAGVAGQDFEAALPLALAAAREGAGRGHRHGVPDMADRIAAALDLAAQKPGLADFADAVGSSVASHHAVPAAFGLVRLVGGDPWAAALLAANIGDDTDTIGAMACAMAAACGGVAALPQAAVDTVIGVNRLDLAPVVAGLLALRTGA